MTNYPSRWACKTFPKWIFIAFSNFDNSISHLQNVKLETQSSEACAKHLLLSHQERSPAGFSLPEKCGLGRQQSASQPTSSNSPSSSCFNADNKYRTSIESVFNQSKTSTHPAYSHPPTIRQITVSIDEGVEADISSSESSCSSPVLLQQPYIAQRKLPPSRSVNNNMESKTSNPTSSFSQQLQMPLCQYTAMLSLSDSPLDKSGPESKQSTDSESFDSQIESDFVSGTAEVTTQRPHKEVKHRQSVISPYPLINHVETAVSNKQITAGSNPTHQFVAGRRASDGLMTTRKIGAVEFCQKLFNTDKAKGHLELNNVRKEHQQLQTQYISNMTDQKDLQDQHIQYCSDVVGGPGTDLFNLKLRSEHGEMRPSIHKRVVIPDRLLNQQQQAPQLIPKPSLDSYSSQTSSHQGMQKQLMKNQLQQMRQMQISQQPQAQVKNYSDFQHAPSIITRRQMIRQSSYKHAQQQTILPPLPVDINPQPLVGAMVDKNTFMLPSLSQPECEGESAQRWPSSSTDNPQFSWTSSVHDPSNFFNAPTHNKDSGRLTSPWSQQLSPVPEQMNSQPTTPVTTVNQWVSNNENQIGLNPNNEPPANWLQNQHDSKQQNSALEQMDTV